MKQQTLAIAADEGAGVETHRKRTRRDEFIDTMNAITPWVELCAVVGQHYPRRGNGRPAIGLERMLRIHVI
jgi:IS5 family transposase